MAIYKQTNNGTKRISTRIAKQEIKEIQGWSESRYQRELKQVKKGLERYQGKTSKTPQEFLYAEARAKKHYGEEYTPSAYVQDIRKLGKLKRRRKNVRKRSILTIKGQIKQLTKKSTMSRFSGLINSNEGAREIYNKIKDPFKQLKALTDYANKLHAEITREGKAIENQAIPFSEQSFGSDISVDFDIENYL